MVFLLSLHDIITAELETVQTRKLMSAPPYLSAGPNPVQDSRLRQCPCCPPANLPRHKNNNYHHKHEYPVDPCEEPQHHQQSWYENDLPCLSLWSYTSHIDSCNSSQMSRMMFRVFLTVSLHRNLPNNRLQLNKDAPNPPRGSVPLCVAPPRDVMHEVSVGLSLQAGPGPATREIRRTISLPEECSKSHQCPLHDHVCITLFS